MTIHKSTQTKRNLHLWQKISDNCTVFAMHDGYTWSNIYLLCLADKKIIVDCGLPRQAKLISDFLYSQHIDPQDIDYVLYTHGHRDHVGCWQLFKEARQFIHKADVELLPPDLRNVIEFYEKAEHADELRVDGLADVAIYAVDSHTPGSVAIYVKSDKTLLVGDFFCFWGEELPQGQLVAFAAECREESYQYVREQAITDAAESKKFAAGLAKIKQLPAAVFASGHGVVLQEEIEGFMCELWSSSNLGEY